VHRTSSRNAVTDHIFPSLARLQLVQLPHEAFAALTLAAVAIPEQIATARLASLPPESGIAAFAAGTLAFAVIGLNPRLSVGADSTTAPVFAAVLGSVAAAQPNAYAADVAFLAFLVGMILLLVRVFRLDWLADLVSVPVAAGVMTGVAVHIIVGQAPALLGIDVSAGSLLAIAFQTFDRLPLSNVSALLLGLAVTVVCLVSERIAQRLPAILMAMALASIAAATLPKNSHALPMLEAMSGDALIRFAAWPPPETLLRLLPLALIIAFLCLIQTALVLRVPDRDPADEADKRESELSNALAGVALGNVVAGLVSAFPVNASPPRTRLLCLAKARSQLSGIIATGIAIAVVGLAGDLLRYVPQAAIAGVLLFVAIRLVPFSTMALVARRSPRELLLTAATAGLVVLLPMQTGIALGIILALLTALSAVLRPRSGEFLRVHGTSIWWPPSTKERSERVEGVVVVGFGAPLNFMTARPMIAQLRQTLADRPVQPKLAVIEATGIIDVDFTGAMLLADAITAIRSHGTEVALARLESQNAQAAATRNGLLDLIGTDRVFLSVDEAIHALDPKPVERPRQD
jgi:sulfate permease, SulP family